MAPYLRSLLTPIGVHRGPRRYRWAAVATPFAAFLLTVAVVQVLLRESTFELVSRVFDGHVQLTLLLPIILVAPVALAFRACSVDVRDGAISGGTVVRAAIQLIMVVGIAQCVLVSYELAAGNELAVAARWQHHFPAVQDLIFQFVGIALVEETLFRGWLLPQCYLRLRARMSEATALVLATLIVNLVFTGTHLPMLLRDPIASQALVSELVRIQVLGLAYTFMYLRTGSLAVCIAFHTVSNEPAAVITSSLPPSEVYAWLFWIRLLVQPVLERVRARPAIC